MKRKLLGVCLTLALVTTLGLVTALPTGAIPTPAAVSFETWDGGGDGSWSFDAPAGFSGSYSVKLTGPMIVKVAYGETVQTFADVTTTTIDTHTVWDIKWTIYDTGGLYLHTKLYLDTTGNDAADTVLTGGFGAVDGGGRATDSWFDAYMRTGTAWQIDGYDGVDYTDAATVGTTTYDAGDDGYTLAALMGHDAAWAAATVVDLAYGYVTGTEAYADDITVDGVALEVEPPLPPLDDDDYKVDDVATVTIYDIDANLNSAVRETILVDADGTIPVHSIVLGLLETGVDTGVFTETFTLVGTTPGTAELLVSHSSVITLTYDTVLVVTADVDNVVPVIVIVSPAADSNIADSTPDIEVSYSDVGSDIDTDSVVMTLAGSPVAATVTGSSANYTVTTAQTDGSYTVTVDVSDIAGNAATQASWSFTVDTVDPVISGQVATPAVVPPAVSSNITFTATVIDATSGVDTVTIDLSDAAIGGVSDEPMLDDGVDPDETADDDIYTAEITATIDTEATYLLAVTATDLATNSVSANITLGVWLDIIDPVISSPAITYEFGSSARPGDDVTISATVTDAGGMGTVTAACTAFATTPVSLTQGVGDAWSGTATVKATAASGDYDITIAATDAKGNVATPDTSLTLTVAAAVTGFDIELEEGWNLISLPLIPDDPDIAAVISATTLASANVTSVVIIRGYDPVAGIFSSYMPSTGGDLTEMVDGVGYWVFMDSADTLTVTGREWPVPPDVPHTYDVVVGWNLIGFKSLEDAEDTDYLVSFTAYPVLWSYDAVTGQYSNVKGGTMLAGHGFWLWALEVGTIVPPE